MSQLCQFKEHIDVTAQEHTPQGIQDLLALLCDLGNVTIDPLSKKNF
jgi:hypothetical protein